MGKYLGYYFQRFGGKEKILDFFMLLTQTQKLFKPKNHLVIEK